MINKYFQEEFDPCVITNLVMPLENQIGKQREEIIPTHPQ